VSDDELERSREAFAAKVDRRYAARPQQPSVGKGSPAALLSVGIISTLVLGACALALGGGLIILPALIPLATVVGVLVARAVVARR
jgi:hypothetical protein